MKKRGLAILMAVMMAISLLPTAAWAEETPTEGGGSEPSSAKTIYIDAVNGNDSQSDVGTTSEKAYKTLVAAVTAAQSGDTIMLSAANYTLYGIGSAKTTKCKDLTFIGQGADKTGWNIGAEVPDPSKFGTEYNGDYSFDGAGTITFKNMTLRSGSANYLGFIRADNTVVDNCTVNGKTFYWGYTSATFKDTTFHCPKSDYAIWTYSSPTMTFENCTFNSSGKVINVYTDFGAGTHNIQVNYKSCIVNNKGDSLKPVLNINDSNMGDFKYILNISGDNVVSGVKADDITCSRLFGFGGKAANNTGRSVATINAVTVWENGERAVAHNCVDFNADSAGSYDDGINTNDIQYTDGYKDDAFTTTYGSWGWDQGENKLARIVTTTCNYCGDSVEDTEYKDLVLDVSRSKTASELDANKQSTITLSLPSAQEKLASDVVFVLDKSSCSAETAASATQMLVDLQSQVQSEGSKIQVGVVVFGGDAKVAYSLKAFPVTETALGELKTALSTRPAGLMSGSNMHAGLLAAQEMLKSSATDNSRKYVILVSDGLTRLFTGSDGKTKDIYYQYTYSDKTGNKQVGTESNQIHPKNCVYFGMIGEWVNVRTQSNSDSNYVIPYGSWDTYFSKVKEWVKADGDSYALDYETYGNDPTEKVKDKDTGAITDPNFKYIGHNDYENHAMSVDRAVYEAYNSFTGMVDSGYRCYAVLPGSGTPFGTAFMGAMNEYAKNSGNIDFTSIGNDILYAVGTGSTVKDKMGNEFDFVPGSLKLTVNHIEIDSKADGNVTYFGAKDPTKEIGSDNYRFKVDYDPANDMFTWTINENVSNFAPVQLSYQVKLVNASTAAGTYTVPTNEYAKLTPMDSDGYVGKTLEFPVPTVSYTVRSSGGGGSSRPTLNTEDHYGYIVGYPDGTVRPQGEITRAEVATIFFRMLTDESRTQYWSQENGYSDVAQGQWFNAAVSTLSKAGIISGYPDGSFRPNGSITRAEFATIAVRFFDVQYDGAHLFPDIDGHWAQDYIDQAGSAGLVSGYPDGTFAPDRSITRAEAVTLVNRTLDRHSDPAHFLKDMLVWPDNMDTKAWYYADMQEATNSHQYEMKTDSDKTKHEVWTKMLPIRDWEAFEKAWSDAGSASNPGEVVNK